MSTQDEAKKAAGRRVIEEFVRDGMKLGLGSGTTSHFFVRELGKHVAGGMKLTCTTTSRSTIDVAREVGIRITEPNEIGEIDLTIDGPDEIDRDFNMIKGGGACLLWEKIIAHASKRMITICDESKIVDRLGAWCRKPLPTTAFPASASNGACATASPSSPTAAISSSTATASPFPSRQGWRSR